MRILVAPGGQDGWKQYVASATDGDHDYVSDPKEISIAAVHNLMRKLGLETATWKMLGSNKIHQARLK